MTNSMGSFNDSVNDQKLIVRKGEDRKRKRASSNVSLPTPPEQERSKLLDEETLPNTGNSTVQTSIHALQATIAALQHVTALYSTSTTAQTSLCRAISAIHAAHARGNRLVACGVGKSSFIAQKFVATCKSLSLPGGFLHACEAVHGDLGDVRAGDVVLFISYSGRTPELLNLMPHLPEDVQIVALSGQMRREDCRLLDELDDGEGILLPAPLHEPEEVSFGVTAPTTSTTVALAVADMLALTLAEQRHGASKQAVFKRNHPGGAIGMNGGKRMKAEEQTRKDVDVALLELPSPSISGEDDR